MAALDLGEQGARGGRLFECMREIALLPTDGGARAGSRQKDTSSTFKLSGPCRGRNDDDDDYNDRVDFDGDGLQLLTICAQFLNRIKVTHHAAWDMRQRGPLPSVEMISSSQSN